MRKIKRKKIKVKRLIIIGFSFMLVFFYLFSTASCTRASDRMEVRIEIENPHAIDFEKYDKILYKDLALEWSAKDFTPEEQLRSFFLDELARNIDKNIESWDDNSSDPEAGIPADALLITGKLTLEIKERSKIKEKKDETGKTKNIFVGIQHWSMTMAVVMKDGSTGKDIFKQDFTEKLSDVDSSETTTKYNFEKIFFRMTNRLMMKVKKTIGLILFLIGIVILVGSIKLTGFFVSEIINVKETTSLIIGLIF